MKNSNETVGNRTHNLPACSAVSQPTAPPRTPCIYMRVCVCVCVCVNTSLDMEQVQILRKIKGYCWHHIDERDNAVDCPELK